MVKSVLDVTKKENKMKKWVSTLLVATMCVLSIGCGVKGPLYFPEKTPVQDTVK